MKVVFCKDDFHLIFFFLIEKHVKIIYCKNDFHLNFLLKVISSKDDFQLSPGDECKSNQNSFFKKTILIEKIVFSKDDFQSAYFSN